MASKVLNDKELQKSVPSNDDLNSILSGIKERSSRAADQQPLIATQQEEEDTGKSE